MEFAKQVIEINYYGTKNMIKAMIPLMRPSPAGARIVNVRSRLGASASGTRGFLAHVGLWEFFPHIGLYPNYFLNCDVCYSDLIGRQVLHSSIGRCVLLETYGGRHMLLESYGGWVKTAMNGWSGNVSAEHAADTGVWLALLPIKEVTGKLFAERRELKL
ncbi:hypothetical protein F3Y22_tig00110429pilonHSYRG00259 [Hibiscus syriacus]|uniref:Uncharacterized protein n=1 Tax=Hibiscus syriacus TaxID=106335 RepID=A0A6A3APF5_HIBSY|nr:hypothetical protein F3Y22_tig00110429pilonHSYRG00259 [Hibiscus syriacus]